MILSVSNSMGPPTIICVHSVLRDVAADPELCGFQERQGGGVGGEQVAGANVDGFDGAIGGGEDVEFFDLFLQGVDGGLLGVDGGLGGGDVFGAVAVFHE